MKECRTRTPRGTEPALRSDVAALASLFPLEPDSRGSSEDGSAVPIEIITGEVTSPYPIGLCDDLCGLSSCRRHTATH